MVGLRPCRKRVVHHSSARAYPEAVDGYLDKEIAQGAMLGPFGHILSSHLNISPLMSRPKDGSSRHIIVDLSFGDDSVNNISLRGVYDGFKFELTLPSLDNLILDVIKC